jgi:hypothetical protein
VKALSDDLIKESVSPMATEDKVHIQISYKADLKDLVANLKQMPNVTDQEAKKMVAALDRQLKQAEKAAKKSAQASKKAAQEASKAAARGSHDFDDMADSARRQKKAWKGWGIQWRHRPGFQFYGFGPRGVNPQLAEAADGLADAFAVTEGLTMSFTALNPIVIAGGVALAALTLGYVAYQAEIEAARQLTLDLRDAQKQLTATQKAHSENLLDAQDKIHEIRTQYKLLTGQITQYEVDLERAGRTAEQSFQSNIDTIQSSIQETENLIGTTESLIEARLGVTAAILSEDEKDKLRTMQLQTDSVKNNLDLTDRTQDSNIELMKLQKVLLSQLEEQKFALLGIETAQKEAVKLSQDMVTLEKELADETEAHAKAAKKVVKPAVQAKEAKEDELDALNKLMEAENRYFDRQMSARSQLKALSQETQFTEDEQKELSFQKELENIRELGEAAEEQGLAAEIIQKKLHDKKMEDLKAEKDAKKEQFEKDLENAHAVAGAMAQFSQAVLTAAMENGRASQKTILGLFRMNQVASVAEIAFNTAKAVTAALAYPPIARAAMITAAVGTGAAQTAVVMGQQPPQASFHMGGMAPDEMGARVLKGEAVLDRATVRNIGGEQGVRSLQQGASGGQVMVIQPFKHFGRFTREIGFVPPKKTGIRGY